MPIEPSSVSAKPVREVEKSSSNLGSWTSMQGSSTGGKDSPTNSIWEKAINGAQKLFRLDSSDSTQLEDESEKEEHGEKQVSLLENRSLSHVPGFGGQGFCGFGTTPLGRNAFGSVVTSRAASDSSSSQLERSLDSRNEIGSERLSVPEKREYEAKESNVQSAKPERGGVASEALEGESDEEKAARLSRSNAASASKGNSTTGAIAAGPLPQQAPPSTASSVDQTVVSDKASPAQLTSAVPVVTQATETQQSSISASQVAGLSQQKKPADSPVAVSSQSVSSQNLNTSVPSKSSESQSPVQAKTLPQSVSEAVTKPVEPTVKPAAPATIEAPVKLASEGADKNKLTVPTQSQSETTNPNKMDTSSATVTNQTQAKPVVEQALPDKALSKESLGFDVSKAKEGVSEGLSQTSSRSVKSSASPFQTPQSQSAATTATQVSSATESRDSGLGSSNGEARSIRSFDSNLSESKDLVQGDASKKEAAVGAQQRPATVKSAVSEALSGARSNGSGSEGSMIDSKTSSAAANSAASANQVARESANAAAARVQVPTNTGRPAGTPQGGAVQTSINGVSTGQGQSVGLASQGNQQGGAQNQNGGDPAAKRDFSEALKQTTGSKSVDKSSADPSQSFDSKVELASGRRTEAASKARQTSYVSKTAEEVKETIATLTKSIDRLVTNKAGTMSLKINFEGGGSVNLRISMEGGQVSTSMQTDVVGLEGAIKANWNDLASDWNQKGVKLNTPQFQNSEGSKDSSFDNQSEFASKQDRQAAGQGGDGRGRSAGSQSSGPRGFTGESQETVESESNQLEGKETLTSSKELKVYA